MIIRKFKKEDAKAICVLVCKTFKEFVAPVCTKRGVKEWLEEQTPEKQIKRAKIRDIYVATINNKVVGMIEGKENDRITRLFVDKKYHRKGIARNLTNKIEKLYRKKGSKKMLTRSSLYAQKFYEKMGYKKIGGRIKRKGILYQPMKKVLR